MSIQITCQGCGSSFKAKDALAGKKVRCPKCETAIVVPQPSELGDLLDKKPPASPVPASPPPTPLTPPLTLADSGASSLDRDFGRVSTNAKTLEVYEHSGVTPFSGLVLAMAVGMLTALIAGFIYTFAIVWIPIIYLNILLTFGYGAVLGMGAGWGAKIGKIRNTFITAGLGVFTALVGIYVEWGVSPIALIGWDEVGMHGFRPDVMLSFGQVLFREGSWGLAGGNVTGIFLVLVWLIEAGIIVVTAVTTASAFTAEPFCERCNRWLKTEEGVQRLRGDQESEWDAVLAGDMTRLANLTPAEDSENPFVRLNLASCENCHDSNFLTIEVVTISVDSDGNAKESTVPLIERTIIGADQAALIRQRPQAV